MTFSPYRALKRVTDVTVASCLLVLLSPVLLAASLTIWSSMGRPILFRQVRAGYMGRPFALMKLRTMRSPSVGEDPYRTDALRLTRVGRFLRRSSIDELPSLWNVIRGEMSLVGPRPLLMEYLDRYTPEQARRHEVTPGITGWAQINGRQALRFSERLRLDVWYVDHAGFLLDLRILFMTVWRVLKSENVLPGQRVEEVDDLQLFTSRSGSRD